MASPVAQVVADGAADTKGPVLFIAESTFVCTVVPLH